MLAFNAQPIVDARLRGFKPADMVIVSTVGHVHTANHVVRAVPGMAYDWRWVHGLEVCVYIGDQPNWYDTVKAIALHRPEWLGIWSCTGHWGLNVYLIPTADDVATPVRQWEYELDYLEWMDFQKDDFIKGRTYKLTPQGMPYADFA